MKRKTTLQEESTCRDVAMRGEAPRRLKLKEKTLIVKKRQCAFSAWQTGLFAVLLVAALLMWASADARDITFESGIAPSPANPARALDDDRAFVAAFVGDVMLGRDTAPVAQHYGYDVLFEKTEALWADADYVFGNLECTLLDDVSAYDEEDKEEHFWAPDEAAAALADAGFTIMQTANNHTVDYGDAGLVHTLDVLADNGVQTVGAGSNLSRAQAPATDAYGSLVVKTFAVSDVVPADSHAKKRSAGILSFDEGDIYQAIANARADADLIIVGAHWGLGYTRSYSEDQQSMAHSLIDAGADIVIGTHSHTLAPVERYNGGIIFYGLGNFVADDAWARARDSVIVRFTVQQDGSSAFELRPLRIESGIPRPTTNAVSIKRDWAVLTRALDDGGYSIQSGILTIPFQTFDLAEPVGNVEPLNSSDAGEPASPSVSAPAAEQRASEEGAVDDE